MDIYFGIIYGVADPGIIIIRDKGHIRHVITSSTIMQFADNNINQYENKEYYVI